MNRRRAFTLPEVLATMVIIAIIIPVAMRGITTSVQVAGDARHKLEAAQLAQNKLNEFLVDRASTGLDGSGDFGTNFPDYRWESHSSAVTSNITADIFQVDVTVHWTAPQGTDRSVTLSTMIYPTDTTGGT